MKESERLRDRINHITNLVDLEWNGQITRSELVKRLTDIVKEEKERKMKNWKEFKKNHPEDYKKCCGKIYLKCKCKLKERKRK